MNFFKRAKTRYILYRHPIEQAVWHAVTENLNVLQGLSAVEKAHLRELSTLFLQEKTIIGVNLTITD
ncbi:MAG: zinc-dependent peptidase, partial [Methylomonas lenta]|nr:zinc-dependent peptidase [Methylomonas lenta]